MYHVQCVSYMYFYLTSPQWHPNLLDCLRILFENILPFFLLKCGNMWAFTVIRFALTLLLLVPFSYKLMHHLKLFANCGFEWWNNCVQCWFPKWFWIVVQLIQNLVWILLSGESMAPLKPFEWIWIVQLATNTVQMVSPCVYKTNRHFWKWKFLMVSNGLSVGGLMVLYFTSVDPGLNPTQTQAYMWIGFSVTTW